MGERTNLKVLRVSKKMTQQQFADEIGVKRSTYSLIETGARSGKPSFWANVQNAFNVPDADMFKLMKCDGD